MRSAAPLSCSAPEAVALVAADGRFVLPRVEVGGMALRLVPDSGADAPVLFHRGGSGETTRIVSVKVERARVKDMVAYTVERADANADGLLPLQYFNAVTFAAGGGCLVVNWYSARTVRSTLRFGSAEGVPPPDESPPPGSRGSTTQRTLGFGFDARSSRAIASPASSAACVSTAPLGVRHPMRSNSAFTSALVVAVESSSTSSACRSSC